MSAVLITGSLAYDTVCTLDDRFDALILPEQVKELNLTFRASGMSRSFGGCAANIAWSLKLLGGSPLILSAAGRDAGEYLQRLESAGIDTRLIRIFPQEWTAQVFITMDCQGNQLATFMPGAMRRSGEIPVPAGAAALAHISPGDPLEMAQHAAECQALGLPYVFDPGQTTSQLAPEALLRIAKGAFLVCLSHYEASLLEARCGVAPESLVSERRTILITHGAEGSEFLTASGPVQLPAAPVRAVASAVGAGDAYRGGLLHGLTLGLSWESCGKLGALMAAFKLESASPQGFRPSMREIEARYEQAWKEPLPRFRKSGS